MVQNINKNKEELMLKISSLNEYIKRLKNNKIDEETPYMLL